MQVRKQVVWRSLKEFRDMYDELVAEAKKSSCSLPAFPASPSWLSSLWTDSHDRAESQRCDLDCLMKVRASGRAGRACVLGVRGGATVRSPRTCICTCVPVRTFVYAHFLPPCLLAPPAAAALPLQDALSLPAVSSSRQFRRFLSPADRPDWPSTIGDINLLVHDLPHASSATEWWYYNCHFNDAAGNEYSAFVAFFRVVKHVDKVTGAKSYAHALNWALTDVTNKRYVQECVLDKDSPASK